MACTNCSSKSDQSGTPKGCKNNGSCSTGGCNKLSVFDWLSNMEFPEGHLPFDVVEVRFKNGRKDFYKNKENLTLSIGDIVATEAASGHDIGVVTLTGELVRVQMNKKRVNPEGALLKIYRKATQKDIDIWTSCREKEEAVQIRSREIAIALHLEMKISDIEFQGDGSKVTFYYTANDRVDFRQLIKEFAREFSTRIEMKQVGFRQEAARLGGIGSCGRELCCSTWLTDFRSVNTAAARYQQLSLNPQKLAGQCGKLKCCLNYELDSYLDALKTLPGADTKISTEKGEAICQKMDIFKGMMWFSYTNNYSSFIALEQETVKELIQKNKNGIAIDCLESYAAEKSESKDKDTFSVSENSLTEDSLNRFDQPKRRRNNPSTQRKKKNTEKQEVATVVKEKSANAAENKRRPQRANNNSQNSKAQTTAPKKNTTANNRNVNRNRNNHANQPKNKEA